MTTETWTRDEERYLQDLLARKARVVAARTAPLVALVERMRHVEREDIRTETVDWLIDNADAMRDALAPFDSGVRVEAPKPGLYQAVDGGVLAAPTRPKVPQPTRA